MKTNNSLRSFHLLIGSELKQLFYAEGNSISLKKDAWLFQRGEYPRFVYFIVKGSVISCRPLPQGNCTKTLHETGSFLEFSSLLNGQRYTLSASCREDSEIRMMARQLFMDLLHHKPVLLNHFLLAMAHHLETQVDALLELNFNAVQKRLAAHLCLLSEKKADSQELYAITDIALLLMAKLSTVYHVLHAFQQKGLIQFHRLHTHIAVLDPAGLKEINNVQKYV